jgi:UDP-glucose 4-epimerase
MGTGDEVRDWLHVEDAAELLLIAAEHASTFCPIVNGGSGEGRTVREVLVQIAASLPEQSLAPSFSGAQRAGDPSRYIADIIGAKGWGWLPKHHWIEGMAEYATWWMRHSQ